MLSWTEKALDYLNNSQFQIDLAFIAVFPSIEEDYLQSFQAFAQQIKPKKIIPMLYDTFVNHPSPDHQSYLETAEENALIYQILDIGEVVTLP